MAVRDDFAAGEVLAAADLNDTFASKLDATAGNIVQAVFAEATTQVLVNTVTYTDTGLSATITPSSASNKVLVLASQAATIAADVARAIYLDYRLMRDAVAVFTSEDFGHGADDLEALFGMIPITYLDSPNTTSAVTYKVQGRPDSTGDNMRALFQTSGRPRSHIVLLEVTG